MRLELKHLAPYLPYKMKFVIDMYEFTEGNCKHEVRCFTMGNDLSMCLNYGKPILRPLSDLTKEIEINKKNIIPLIELHRCSNEYNHNKYLDYEFIDSWGAKGNILKVFHDRKKDEYTEFVFSNLDFRKDTRYSEYSNVYQINIQHPIRVNNKIYNQHKLFDLLYRWHFDIFGLIEQGLAIDINALKND